jgi:ComF family protein
MRKSILKGLLEDFISLLFPSYCLACYDALLKGEEIVCTSCMLEMPQTQSHLDPENALKQRLGIRIPLSYAFAIFRFSKSSRVQELLHALKYKQQPEVGIALGKMYGEKLIQAGLQNAWDIIVPIPLHPSRFRKRGYNQSEKFAEGLSEKLKIPVITNAVKRNYRTETQTRKSKKQRWENVKTVFELSHAQYLSGRKVLLVDDVITTGATIEACGTVLMEGGCRELSIACIAEA